MPVLGSPHRHFRITDSTNARARELAEAGAPGGLVVTAAEQLSGRGRRGRRWEARAGSGLLYSALVRPLGERPLLPLAAAVAVSEAAEALGGEACQIKWPNDVWLDGLKLAGVLIEGHPAEGESGWAVVGIGLNLGMPADPLPPELAGTVAWLGQGGAATPFGDALSAVNESLGRWMDAEDDTVLAAFRSRDALEGREISWDDGQGLCEGIDDRGHLIVRVGDEPRLLGAGEVSLIRPD